MEESSEVDFGTVSQSAQEWENGIKKTIEANGHTWHYIEYGNPQGTPLINIHGWLGSSADGNDLLSRTFAGEAVSSPGLSALNQTSPESAQGLTERVQNLKGKYHVITPELPGFGVTEALEGKVSLDQIAENLVGFQKALSANQAILFGSSMGGILAIKMAAAHPESAKALVVQGTMTQPKDMDKVTYALAQVMTWGPIPKVMAKLNLTGKLFTATVKGSKDFQIADKPTQDRIIEATLKSDPMTAATTLKEIGKDIGDDINKVTCPVIVVDGANGTLVPILKSQEAAKRFYPDSPLPEKIPQKVVFLPLGGDAGEQGHNIVNTLPEGVVSWVDYTLNKMAEDPQNQSPAQSAA